MPKPDLEVPTPENCIGYGCVIVKDLDEFQGFFICDDKSIWKEANVAMMTAMMTGAHPIGALQAVVVDRVLHKDWRGTGVAALALTSLTKMNYWVIHASKEAEGTRSEMKPLNATSVEEARVAIDAMPEVMEIKARLVKAMRQPKQ